MADSAIFAASICNQGTLVGYRGTIRFASLQKMWKRQHFALPLGITDSNCFGLTNALAIFQAAMHNMLRPKLTLTKLW